LGKIVGSLFISYALTYTGRKNCLVIAMSFFTIATFGIAFSDVFVNVAGFIIFVSVMRFLQGFCIGIMIGIMTVIICTLFQDDVDKAFGVLIGA
jgi:MFS family permease